MLSAKDLTYIRNTVNRYMPGTAVIYTRSAASDGAGGQSVSFTATGTVPVRYGPERPASGDTGTEMREVQRTSIWLPVGSTVYQYDRLRNPGTGTDYEIISMTVESSDTGVYRCECDRVR